MRILLGIEPKRIFLHLANTSSCSLRSNIITKHHYYSPSSCLSINNAVGNNPITIANALTFSGNAKSYFYGSQIHAHIFKLGFTDDVFTQNNLIKTYSKCGVLIDGLRVFDEMSERNLVSWTLVISGANENGEYALAIETFVDLTISGFLPNEFALGSVMKACINLGVNELGLCVHCFVCKVGMEKNPFVCSSIIHMYAKNGMVKAAEQIFEDMDSSDVGCWNAMIGGYAQRGCGFEAVKTFSFMHSEVVLMDTFTFVNALNGCSFIGDLHVGCQIHGMIVKNGERSTSVLNSLIQMYFKNEESILALKLFHAMGKKDVVSWNTVFAGLCQDVKATEMAELFYNFMLEDLKPNCVTFQILFRFCGDVLELDLGLQFCCIAFHYGVHNKPSVCSSLINMFSRCGVTEMARKVFDTAPFSNINNWNEMILGYSLSCDAEALKLFSNLRELGVEANECTYSSTLEACLKTANLQAGRQIHSIAVKSGFAFDGYVCSSLVKIYVEFGLLDESSSFFSGPEKLDLASWSAFISSLVHRGCDSKAIKILNYLKEDGEEPDEFILGSIFKACSNITSQHLTKSIHSLILKVGFDSHVFVASAIIDAYAKCGDIKSAEVAFHLSSESVDVVILNTMIMAYAHHGRVTEAMEIFERMKMANLKPNQATFVSVISACRHVGLVNLGRTLFKSITLDYGMQPSPDNYGCLVDLLARNGSLEEAQNLVDRMPYPPWPAIWRSLLNGCRIHGNKVVGEYVAKKLVDLCPNNEASYVLLSKVYSEEGNWEDATKLRDGMIDRGVQKDMGRSWIEI